MSGEEKIMPDIPQATRQRMVETAMEVLAERARAQQLAVPGVYLFKRWTPRHLHVTLRAFNRRRK